jgi:hypothetical protein
VVDIDVRHAIVPLQKLKDTKDAARDGTQTGVLALFA